MAKLELALIILVPLTLTVRLTRVPLAPMAKPTWVPRVHMAKPPATRVLMDKAPLKVLLAQVLILNQPTLHLPARKTLLLRTTMLQHLRELPGTTKANWERLGTASTVTQKLALHPTSWQPKLNRSGHTTPLPTRLLPGRESSVPPSAAVSAWV